MNVENIQIKVKCAYYDAEQNDEETRIKVHETMLTYK